jgi:hypothetical protein
MGGGSGTAGTAGTAGTGQGRNRDRDRDLGGSANDARLQESKSTSRKTTVLLKRGLEDLKESDTVRKAAARMIFFRLELKNMGDHFIQAIVLYFSFSDRFACTGGS